MFCPYTVYVVDGSGMEHFSSGRVLFFTVKIRQVFEVTVLSDNCCSSCCKVGCLLYTLCFIFDALYELSDDSTVMNCGMYSNVVVTVPFSHVMNLV